MTFDGTFHQIYELDGSTHHLLEEAWRAHSTPFANVMIDDSARAIAAGDHDAGIRSFAQGVKRWLDAGGGRSLILAPLQEMNGDWVPYGVDPAHYRAAYRRVYDIFHELGIDSTQIRWAFAPNGWSTPPHRIADYYPGDDVVDLIAFSGYNFAQGHWSPVEEVAAGVVAELRNTVNDKIPYLIGQVGSGSAGGDKDAWMRDLFRFVAADPNLVGFVYFNFDKETDWLVVPGGEGSTGWRDGMAMTETQHEWPLTRWFQPGPLPFGPYAEAARTGDPCPDGRRCDTVGLVDGGARLEVLDAIRPVRGETSFVFGNPGDVHLLGDWDCDGLRTPGIFRPATGEVALRNHLSTGAADVTFTFGDAGDIPLAGDFNGDGCETLAVYRPSEGRVFMKNTLTGGGADLAFYFGNPSDKPFVGDFDGDGVDTLGLHRESTGMVYLRNSNTQGNADASFYYGNPGDQLIAGDWDGDGVDTIAVYRPSTEVLYLRNENTPGNASHTLVVGRPERVLVARGM